MSARRRKVLFVVIAVLVLAAVAAGIYYYMQRQEAIEKQQYADATKRLDSSDVKSLVDKDRVARYGQLLTAGNTAKADAIYKDAVADTDNRDEKLKLLEEYRKAARLYGNDSQEVEAAKLYANIMETYDTYWAAASIAGKHGDTSTQKEYLLKAYEAAGVPEEKREELRVADTEQQAELWKAVE